MAKPTQLALLLKVINDGEFFHLDLKFVDWVSTGVEWLRYADITIGKTPIELEHLVLRCQGDANSRKQGRVYGYEARYRDLYAVDLDDAQKFARTLTFLKRGLAKIETTFGHATTYEDYVTRVAAVFKVKTLIVRRVDEPNGWYNGGDYRAMSMADGKFHIHRLIADWAAPVLAVAVAS